MYDFSCLTVFLRRLSPGTREIELSFPQIARIIDDSLMPSAYESIKWWSNDPAHPQARSWLDAGWQVREVDLQKKTVNFARILIYVPIKR